MLRLTVIVPAYNEELLIGRVIDDIRQFQNQYDLEIIAIEGGSKDRTADVAREHGATKVISFPKKRGKGADVWTATLASTGDYIIQIDADHQFQPSQIPKMMELFEKGADVVLGSRFWSDASCDPHSVSITNHFGNWFLSLATSIFIGQRITDVMAGFKGFRRSVIPKLQLKVAHFGYEAELVVRALRANCRIVEMPLIYTKRETGVSNVQHIKDGILVLGSILRARFTPLKPQIATCPTCACPVVSEAGSTTHGRCDSCGSRVPYHAV